MLGTLTSEKFTTVVIALNRPWEEEGKGREEKGETTSRLEGPSGHGLR